MNSNSRKGDLSMEHVAIFVLLIALLIVVLIYTGVLRVQLGDMLKKFIDVLVGR